MKILMTMFDINNYGGIVNHAEFLRMGFAEIGHECDFILLRHTDREYKKRINTKVQGAYHSSSKEELVHAEYGWYGVDVFGYQGEARQKAWKKKCSKYDLVLHQIPVPSSQMLDENGDWKQVYEIPTKQIVAVHDTHFPTLYPHFLAVAKHIAGVGAVHPASYRSLDAFPVNRALIGSPHRLLDWSKQPSWENRRKRFISAHIWKAWKNMHLVVRSIPYLSKNVENIMGGDGIEARYMASKSKCPPEHKGIWERAEKEGMDYRAIIPNPKLLKLYTRSRAMVDLSYSKAIARLGCHFNRSTMEAYNGGCVPLVVRENMRENGFPKRFFRSGHTHLSLRWGFTPKELADSIMQAVELPSKDAEHIVESGRKILKENFEYKICAQQFIDLSKGKPTGAYGILEPGKASSDLQEVCDRLIRQKEGKHKRLF